MKYEKIPALVWEDNTLKLLDQRYLPHRQEIVEVTTVEGCFNAIRDMVVRGAPLIGFTAIWGVVISVINDGDVEKDIDYLKEARPTAVNLAYELERCRELFHAFGGDENFLSILINFASEQFDKLANDNQTMADLALKELDERVGKDKYNILTICNTGYLACGPIGTALGVISNAHAKGRLERAYATETRPYLQGSRLTAYEMMTENIPFDVVVEGAFSYLLKSGKVDAIFAGADRIAANGDTANKIGTSTLSIVAKEYGVPFYIVAPTSSFDLSLNSGNEIPIELRDEKEVLEVFGKPIAPIGATALNPSFDVTDSKFITGIFCENGMISNFEIENVKSTVNGK